MGLTNAVRTWLRRWSYLLRQSRYEAELHEEIEAHRQLRQAQLERDGLSAHAAEEASRRAIGNVRLVRDEARQVWIGSWDTWWQDVRYGLRVLRRSPGAAIVVTLTIAVGIGMNAAMFGVFHAVLIRPLAYPNAERLVWLSPHAQRFDLDTYVSRADFLVWRAHAPSFERMAAYGQQDVAVFADGEAREERVTSVSEDFWAISGARADLGRLFGPEEHDAVVLSHVLFERRFHADPSVLGRSVTLNGYRVTIVGVLPSDYRVAFPAMPQDDIRDAAAYLALPTTSNRPGDADRAIPGALPVPAWVRVVGRLRPDVTLDRARGELQGVYDQLARDFPGPLREGYTLRVVPLQQKIVGPVKVALIVLLVAVAFVLLIATTNIAHLLLARAVSRQTEIAIRASLGAGRLRILRQLLSESLVLAALGGAAGLVLAQWALAAIVRLWPHAIPRLEDAAINPPVVLFALALTLLSTVLFGAAPAFSAWSTDLMRVLGRADRTASCTPAMARLRGVLVGLELALAAALLIGAGLMLRSLWVMTSGPPGLHPERVLIAKVSLSGSRYAGRLPQEHYVDDVLQRLDGLPGVAAAGIDAGSFNFPVTVDGIGQPAAGPQAFATFKPVSLGYLRVMGVPLLRGHWPGDRALAGDALESTDALVVNQRFVDLMMHGEDPIGRHVRGPFLSGTIAGVVADFKDWQLDTRPLPQVYVPFKRAMILRSLRIVLRIDSDPVAAAAAIRQTIAQIDRTQAVADFATLDQVLASSITDRRFSLSLLGLFAAVAVFLALTGAYGVIAHSVAQRRREIAIRIALGARPSDVVRQVVTHEMGVAAAGIALGLVGALVLAPVMASLLYDVPARDPMTFIAVGAALALASLLTSWSAAFRAARVDPMIVLR